MRLRACLALAAVPGAAGDWGMREAVAVAGVADALAGVDENGAQLPLGPYAAQCMGCAVSLGEATLACRCGPKSKPSTYALRDCAPPRWIALDADGSLACLDAPSSTADARAFRERGDVHAARLAERVMHHAWRAGSASEF